MRIYTKLVWDIETMALLEAVAEDYSGPLEIAKGADEANNQRKEQLDLQKQQLAMQNSTLNTIKGGVGKYLTGDIGFSPAEMAMLSSQFLNNNSQDFASAGSAVRDALASKGMGTGALPVGGTYTRGLSGLLGAQASQHGAGLLNLGISDAQQALTNKFNAASVLNGSAATLGSNVSTFGQGASSALGDYIKAANQSFGGMFMNSLGGALGAGLGNAAVGGLGTGVSKLGSGNWGW